MEKRIVLACSVTALLWLLCAENSCETLMEFSRGSQRTVEIILSTKKITRMVNKTYRIPLTTMSYTPWLEFRDDYEVNETELFQADLGDLVDLCNGSSWGDSCRIWIRSPLWLSFSPEDPSLRAAWLREGRDVAVSFCESAAVSFSKRNTTIKCQAVKVRFNSFETIYGKYIYKEAIILVTINETVIINQTKREVYKPRSSPSNKFMKAVNGIKRAEANANAVRVKYSSATLAKLKGLVEKAIRSKSYTYAREVTGKIMYLLKTRSSRRKKRSFTDELNKFLQDLRKKVGNDKFDAFLAVQGEVGLMFAIDDTGSMSGEISAAKKIAKHIIYHKRKSPILEYILSPFNDPYPYPTNADPVIVKDETEAGEFVKEIEKLRAHGGGDCPEYTFEGMRGALNNMAVDGSPLYVFTDAGPKDATEADIEEVKTLAEVFDVAINFFTTGYCHSRGFSSGDPKNLHPAFQDLAKSTSGLAIVFNNALELEQLSSLTIKVLEGDAIISTGSTTNNRKKRSAGGSSDSRYTIPVDDSIEKMSVTITTATEGRGIVLKNADNVEITSGKLSVLHITIYEITNPSKGTWTLTVPGSNGDHEYSVKSSSDSNVDFDHYFLTKLSWRRRSTEVLVSNPVVGNLNKIIISVAGSEKLQKSSLRLQLVTTEGKYISSLTLQPQSQGSFLVNFNAHAPGQPFKLKLKGTTKRGYPFERISHKIHKLTTAVLRGTYASNLDTLPLNRTTFIRFQLCNFGTTETFDFLVAKDTLRFVFRRRLSPRRVIKGRCVYISIFAKATRSEDVGKTDAVIIILKGRISGTVLSETRNLLVDTNN